MAALHRWVIVAGLGATLLALLLLPVSAQEPLTSVSITVSRVTMYADT